MLGPPNGRQVQERAELVKCVFDVQLQGRCRSDGFGIFLQQTALPILRTENRSGESHRGVQSRHEHHDAVISWIMVRITDAASSVLGVFSGTTNIQCVCACD